MKVLYLATTGAGDPTKASIPLHIAANGSVEADQECAVVLAGDATEFVADRGTPCRSATSPNTSPVRTVRTITPSIDTQAAPPRTMKNAPPASPSWTIT